MKSVAVGWEFEVPLEEVREARESHQAELEAHYGAAVESLTDLEIARHLVRIAHPTGRYLSPGLSVGFTPRMA